MWPVANGKTNTVLISELLHQHSTVSTACIHTSQCLIIDLSTIFSNPSKETCVILTTTTKNIFIFRFSWLMALIFGFDLTCVLCLLQIGSAFYSFGAVAVVVVFFLSTDKLIFLVFPIKHLMYGSKVVLLLLLHSFTQFGVLVLLSVCFFACSLLW